jgi:DNA-binding NarL/FixJ family response regulator
LLPRNRLFPIVVRLAVRYTEIIEIKTKVGTVPGKGWGDMIALLVLRPGALRDGLSALLDTMPEIRLLALAEDPDAALKFLARQCAGLVLIKLDAGDRRLLGPVLEMRALCPDTQVVALIEDELDRQVAEASGTDLVVMVGVPAPVLRARLRALLRSVAVAA